MPYHFDPSGFFVPTVAGSTSGTGPPTSSTNNNNHSSALSLSIACSTVASTGPSTPSTIHSNGGHGLEFSTQEPPDTKEGLDELCPVCGDKVSGYVNKKFYWDSKCMPTLIITFHRTVICDRFVKVSSSSFLIMLLIIVIVANLGTIMACWPVKAVKVFSSELCKTKKCIRVSLIEIVTSTNRSENDVRTADFRSA